MDDMDRYSLLKSKSGQTSKGGYEVGDGDVGVGGEERYNLLLRSPGRQRRFPQHQNHQQGGEMGGGGHGRGVGGAVGSEWSRRQTIPRRGPTRKVKLTAGKNLVVEYAVPTAVRNAVEGRWIGGEY